MLSVYTYIFKTQLDPDRSLFDQSSDLPYNTNFEFSRRKIHLQTLLGEGAFGEVWLATAYDIHKLNPRQSKRRVNRRNTILRHFTRKWRASTSKRTLVAVKKLKGTADIYIIYVYLTLHNIHLFLWQYIDINSVLLFRRTLVSYLTIETFSDNYKSYIHILSL